MQVNYGSKRLTTGARYGLRDWMMQRLTAVVMLVFIAALPVQVLLISGPITYDAWAGLFAKQWMKFLTYISVVAMCWHTFAGMRDIYMDYIKPVSLRLALHVFTICWLIGCAGWAFQVLWRL